MPFSPVSNVFLIKIISIVFVIMIFRELLERSVSQKLPARKMKTLFTKYLQFEQVHGSKETQEKVKSKATDYVKQVAGDEPMNDD